MPNNYHVFPEIGSLLKHRNWFLATAESCTGGLLGHLITNVAGSSEYYLGGVIAYSNTLKIELLGVKTGTLLNCGAVSRETVLEMASGIRYVFGEKYSPDRIIGLSTSGIAGPGGGSADKPVGMVCIGISSKDWQDAFLFHFNGSREEIKMQTALQALHILAKHLPE
jgi:nicotinamide-nucleotide amidase